MSVNRLIYSVLFCHFIASMAALGMPLFLPYVLPTLNGHNAIEWAGALFILPTLCTALAARFWGRFADKHGRRLSLLRAQIGLSLGFFLCGMADSITAFVLGLIVQGTFGGAMAASNGYLATQIKERGLLSKTLNKTQLSARLALVVAPISLGCFLAYIRPLDAYLYLTALPLIAFMLTLMLPKDTSKAELSTATQPEPNDVKLSGAYVQPVSLRPLYVLQFLFAFAMVVTFPYFAVFAHSRGIDSQMWIGFLYALPHLVYLLIAGKIHLIQQTTQRTIAIGFSALAIACLLHLLPSIVGIVLARILFGLAMVFCFHGLHKKLTESFDPNASGKVFASFDAMSKWGGVLAGVSAAFLATASQVSDNIASRYLNESTATFLLAAAVSLLALVLSQTRLKPSALEHKQVESTSSHPSSVKGVNSR